MSEGKKYDAGKLRYDLLDTPALKALVEVITFGAAKYGPNNWRGLEDAESRYYAALMRHLEAWRAGEAIDPESGLHHVAHVCCNAHFLLAFAIRRKRAAEAADRFATDNAELLRRLSDSDTMTKTLTTVQARCTELLEENRVMKAMLQGEEKNDDQHQ